MSRRQSRLCRRSARPWLACALALAMLCVCAPVPAALAHAVLLRSDPAQNARLQAAPGRVDLFFSEPLSHAFSSVQVRDANGVRVEKGSARFAGNPTEMTVDLNQFGSGFYTVAWTTVSAVDGHRLQGSYPFIVLNPDGNTPAGTPAPAISSGSDSGPTVPDVLLHWLLLLGLMGTAGAFAFALLVLLPAAGGLAEVDARQARSFSLRLAGLAAGVAAALTLLINPLAVLRQAGQAGALGQLGTFFSGRTGTFGLLREAAALLAFAAALLLRRRGSLAAASVYALLWAGLAAAVAGLATLSLTSHAAARAGAGWSVPSDLIHLTGVAFWLGSLTLIPALLRLDCGLPRPAQQRFRAWALARFSTLAWMSIAAVILTGLFNASVEVASLGNFGGTEYGDILIDKLLIVAPLLLLGLVNAVVLAPRIERAGRMLAVSAGVEAVLGVAVLVATAALIFAVPSRDVAAQKRARLQPSATASSVYRNAAPAGDLQVALTVSPNRAGENDFKALLTGPDAAMALRVELRFQISGAAVGGSTVDLAPVPEVPSLYEARAANLSFVGRWQVAVNVRRADHDDVNGNFTVEVPDATGATTISSPVAGLGTWSFPARGITANQTLGVVFVCAGILLYRFRGPPRRRHRLAGLAGGGLTTLAFLAGFGLFFATHSHGGTAQALENPVPADQRSVDDGQTLFAANCAKCHGAGGHGDGPLAPGLNPKPVDLAVHVGLHPQYQIYDWITNGIPPTAMPAWKSQFSDQQRWDIVNYLETLQAP